MRRVAFTEVHYEAKTQLTKGYSFMFVSFRRVQILDPTRLSFFVCVCVRMCLSVCLSVCLSPPPSLFVSFSPPLPPSLSSYPERVACPWTPLSSCIRKCSDSFTVQSLNFVVKYACCQPSGSIGFNTSKSTCTVPVYRPGTYVAKET